MTFGVGQEMLVILIRFAEDSGGGVNGRAGGIGGKQTKFAGVGLSIGTDHQNDKAEKAVA